MEQISRYVVIRKLGAGGMGEVWLAEDPQLRRRVAIKLLSANLADEPAQRRRFLREARSASALSHPNACVIHEIGEAADGRPFIAMEFVEGTPLDRRLEQGPLAIPEAVAIVRQVAEALDAAHARGIIHRDIKPANINVDARGHVKVLDFGLAKQVGEDSTSASRSTQALTTQSGMILGTPAFMSPEQALGRPLDHRSDLFSLGTVLYQLVTGRLPFPGASVGEVLNKVVHAQPEAIARFNYDAPPELERITLKLLAKDPERRFQSAREVAVDLGGLLRTFESPGGSMAESPSSARTSFEAPSNQTSIEMLPPHDGAPRALGASTVPALVGGGPIDASCPDPNELPGSDVVIAYANLDDQPVAAGRQGWISQFHRNLELRVAQLSGSGVRVLKQPDPSLRADIQPRILERVGEAKTIVSVLSPPFVRSEGCRRIVRAFWEKATGLGRLQVNDRARILKVVKTPVDEREIPPDLAPVLSLLVPYDFFEREASSGRLREFDELFGDVAKQRFYERVYDVAYDISQVLKHFGGVGAGPGGTRSGKRIYLASTTSDLEAQRDQLRRELTELGHEVFPKQPLPLVASEITRIVESCLESCDLAIHLVGERYGFVPEDTELSIVALQNRVAAEASARTGLGRIIWMPRALATRDERQARFVRELEEESAAHLGADVVSDTIENLKVIIARRWEKEAAPSKAPRAPGAPPRVYLLCDRQDEAAVEPLEDFFYEQGIEVSLPGFEANEKELHDVHVQNLRDCDGALVYYGAAGMHWIDFNVRDLQKAAGYRNGRPIAVAAVYLAPPLNRRKERFRSVTVEVLRQPGAAIERAVLDQFADAVRRARAEAAA